MTKGQCVVHDISSGSLHVLLTLFYLKRLLAYDRNHNFQPPLTIIPDPLAEQWPVNGYKQLIPDHRQAFSNISKEQIEGYFLYRLEGMSEN